MLALIMTAVWLWLAAAEASSSLGTVLVNQLPAIIISITGLLVAYSNLKAKMEADRKQAEAEHKATIAKVEAGNQLTEKTHESLNGTLAAWKEETKRAMEAAVAAAFAAGIRQGQGEAALIIHQPQPGPAGPQGEPGPIGEPGPRGKAG